MNVLPPRENRFGVRDGGRGARYDGGNGRGGGDTMDAVTPKGEAQAGVEGHSHVVRPAEMEWQKTTLRGGKL